MVFQIKNFHLMPLLKAKEQERWYHATCNSNFFVEAVTLYISLRLLVLVSFQCQHDTGNGECPICPLSVSPVPSVEGRLHVCIQYQLPRISWSLVQACSAGSAVNCFEIPGSFLYSIWTPSRIFSKSLLR